MMKMNKTRGVAFVTIITRELLLWLTTLLVITGGLWWGLLVMFEFDLTLLAQMGQRVLTRYLVLAGEDIDVP
jgi:uncharacterized membrane protein YuzA (DUF378 family)